jgi:hypothetical protein
VAGPADPLDRVCAATGSAATGRTCPSRDTPASTRPPSFTGRAGTPRSPSEFTGHRFPIPSCAKRTRAAANEPDRGAAELTAQISAVHAESKGPYGAPRIHAELRGRGRRHGRKRVARLMRCAGVRGQTPKRWKTTTIPDPTATEWADLNRRDFAADATKVNARWCGDITYLNTWEGWLYLATVIDITSRRVVGLATADHLRTDLVDQALRNAVTHRRPARGVVFHSDRGCQGGFNRSSQHEVVGAIVGVRRGLRLVSSSREFSGAGC